MIPVSGFPLMTLGPPGKFELGLVLNDQEMMAVAERKADSNISATLLFDTKCDFVCREM